MSAAVLAMACGGGGESRPTPSATGSAESPTVAVEPTPTALPTATPAPEPSTLIAYEVITAMGEQQGSVYLQHATEIVAIDIKTGDRWVLIQNADMYLLGWAWSQDGSQLAALMTSRDLSTDRDSRIDVVAADGTGRRTVWEGTLVGPYTSPDFVPGDYVSFAWHPDGEHLDLVRGSRYDGATWLRIPLDASPPIEIASLDAGSLYSAAPWTGAGAFPIHVGGAAGERRVMLHTSDGMLVDSVEPPDGYEMGLVSWSADGTTAAFNCYQVNAQRHVTADSLCLWESQGGIRTMSDRLPGVLSPDGTKLVATLADNSTQPPSCETSVVSVSTGEGHRLANECVPQAGWSPDSEQVAFLWRGPDAPAAQSGQLQQIYVVDANGSEPRKVTDETQPVAGTPRWQPR